MPLRRIGGSPECPSYRVWERTGDTGIMPLECIILPSGKGLSSDLVHGFCSHGDVICSHVSFTKKLYRHAYRYVRND